MFFKTHPYPSKYLPSDSPDKLLLNIGERITQLRKQHNISQEELANRAQVSRTIIGNYERNANTPSIEVLIKLARVFNVSVDYMIR